MGSNGPRIVAATLVIPGILLEQPDVSQATSDRSDPRRPGAAPADADLPERDQATTDNASRSRHMRIGGLDPLRNDT